MKLESTCYENHKLVLNKEGTPIAVQIDGVVAFRLYDTVEVTGDCRGYICPGIKKPGIGQIIEIRRDSIKVNTKITKKGKIKFTNLDNFLLYRIVKVFYFI